MAVVSFNVDAFLTRYPEFTPFNAANAGRLAAFFDEAGIYLDNTDCSPVQNIARRTQFLYQLTAHIAFINGALTATPDGSRPFGRVMSANEGTVGASFGGPGPSAGDEEWYLQSQYGAAFWIGTSSLRGMHYIPGPEGCVF